MGKKIVLYSCNDQREDLVHTVSFCYAHGKAEEHMGHDILASDRKLDFPPGLHPVVLENDKRQRRDAVLFVWNRYSGTVKGGLCVLCDDVDGARLAAERFAEHSAAF